MKDFEYYLDANDVKRCSLDRQLAVSLVKDMKERIDQASKLDINEFPKMIFENFYDALRDFCDALLALAGYKSYSHEASIVYLSKEGFDIAFISELDGYRYKRNGSKYYGLKITANDANLIIKFYNKNKAKIIRILDKSKL
jgi:hypothetical protein